MGTKIVDGPLVSVIIPTYNSEKTVIRTVESVLNQTYKNLEILIIDDASCDGTVDIIRKLESQYSRIRVHYKSKNKGVADSRNIGIEKSKGKYVAFLDSDDVWCMRKLEKQIQFMESNNLYFTYTNYYIHNPSSKYLEVSTSPEMVDYKKLLRSNTIGCLTVVYNKEEIGEISIPLIKKRNDYALWLEILSRGYKGYLVDENLALNVKRELSLSSGRKTSLLKYHYKLFHDVREFGFIRSWYYTGLNGVYFLIKKIRRNPKVSLRDVENCL